MSWKGRTALLLLLQTYLWLTGVFPPFGAVDFAMHMAEEGEHCYEFCAHPTSLIDPPQISAPFNTVGDVLAYHERLIALSPYPYLARDRPPPLFYSLSHSLRAPPPLMLA